LHLLSLPRITPIQRDGTARRAICKMDRAAKHIGHRVRQKTSGPVCEGLRRREIAVPVFGGVLSLALEVTVRKRCEQGNAVLPCAINIAHCVPNSDPAADEESEVVARHRIYGGRGYGV